MTKVDWTKNEQSVPILGRHVRSQDFLARECGLASAAVTIGYIIVIGRRLSRVVPILDQIARDHKMTSAFQCWWLKLRRKD